MSRKSSSGFKQRQRRALDAQERDRVAAASVRNVDVPRGRDVNVTEVQAYALSGHGKCRGTGIVGAVACSCSTKRFLRAHPEIILVREGDKMGVYWPLKILFGPVDTSTMARGNNEPRAWGHHVKRWAAPAFWALAVAGLLAGEWLVMRQPIPGAARRRDGACREFLAGTR